MNAPLPTGTLTPHFVAGSALCEDAYEFACAAHAGMLRKAGGSPFINHPVRVAAKCHREGMGEAVLAAALLHDVVEDTDHTLGELQVRFGPAVAGLVGALSEDASIGDYARRKHEHCVRLAAGDERVGVLLCADKLCNLLDLLDAYEVEGERLSERFTGDLTFVLEHALDHQRLIASIDGMRRRAIFHEFDRVRRAFAALRADLT